MDVSEQALIALGSNLGDRAAYLAAALKALHAHEAISVLASSPCYETAPVGLLEQPSFLNQVAAVSTSLKPQELLRLLQQFERDAGRQRTVLNGPRTLDLDLLFYGSQTIDLPNLQVPHPRWRERVFVTVPLADLLQAKPLADEPTWDELRKELLELTDCSGVRVWAEG
ncbi:MAG: 2-amino-4-hydroxy-6-hydroxymethyldihydropteridine diphosphokinase [Verrucomicrobiota bacterium]